MDIYYRFLSAMILLTVGSTAAFSAEATIPLGVARSDITPDYSIRQAGYASHVTESEGVAERLWAKALAWQEVIPRTTLC